MSSTTSTSHAQGSIFLPYVQIARTDHWLTCLVPSSNYTLNELLDGPNDKVQPEGAVGFTLAATLNIYFLGSAVWLWAMGVLTSLPPIRSKESSYLDVLSESINNPIRLFLGWFALSLGRSGAARW